jgi:hypothetical protein
VGGWVGVDLDGTLAHYSGWGDGGIGEPVPAMLARVKQWLADGIDVRIVTARVAGVFIGKDTPAERSAFEEHAKVQAWCEKHIGRRLPVTAVKDYAMVELWDDRCIQVEPNTGRRVDGKP